MCGAGGRRKDRNPNGTNRFEDLYVFCGFLLLLLLLASPGSLYAGGVLKRDPFQLHYVDINVSAGVCGLKSLPLSACRVTSRAAGSLTDSHSTVRKTILARP